MFTALRLQLRNYKREPFSFLETIDSRYKEHRYMLTVIEVDTRHYFYLEPEDNLFEILDKLDKEVKVIAVVVTDFKKHIHYYNSRRM